MNCLRCGTANSAGRRFCAECGVSLARACPSCGFSNEAAVKFCGGCGAVLVSGPTPPESRFGSPQAYTPKHLAEKVLTSRGALEGERKQVTVLFADLKGSMELLADRDPEEARRLLDPVLERMMEAVHRYEGTVNQVMGDGIMALFGAPLAHEDHAVRACYAALRMQETVKRYAEAVQRTEGIPVRIRIGVNSREVVVRSIGSDLRMDYTAVGQTTHLAARMEQMAVPGSILVTDQTLDLAEGYVQVTPLGPIPVKGLPAPIEVYEIVGAGTARSRLQAAAARGLTKFVGRSAEIEQLTQALERARSGHGQVVAVVGEPGVGKSRLYWEFTHSHRTQGWLLVESGSVSYGKATAYLPVIELLKAYFQIEARNEVRKIQEKVTGKLLSLDRALEPALSALLSLLDVPVEDPQWQGLDPSQRRQRTLDGVKRLLLRESQVQPLLILFEDLHWIDAETQALVDGLVESLPTARLLLLVNYRPEYQHGWGSKTYYRQLRIDPLPPESADELLEGLLGDDASLLPLTRLLIERTEGNPLFLEESVRTLVETQVLVGERGAYRLAKDARAVQVPATVQAILAARIDRLAPEDKRLLQAASVIGKDVPFGLLQAIAELPEEGLRLGLGRLQTAEFVYEARLFPDLEYTFRHALTHEVAYGSLLQDRRRALHARIVEAIEALYPEDRLIEQVERLAYHALRGEVWERAAGHSHQAGTKAVGRSALREAVDFFDQAVAALDRLPERREAQEPAVDIRLALRYVLFQLGEPGRQLDLLRQAEAVAVALGDERRLSRVLQAESHYFWFTGEQDRAAEAGLRARALAETLADHAEVYRANFSLGQCYHVMGDYRDAIDTLRRNLAAEREQGQALAAVPGSRVIVRSVLASSLAEIGDFAEAIAQGEDGVRLAEAVDQPFVLIGALLGASLVHLRQGDLGKAIPVLERARSLCETWGIRGLLNGVLSRLGYAYALDGRTAEGIALLQDAVTLGVPTGTRVGHGLRLAWLAEAQLLAGRPADAATMADQALTFVRNQKERGNEAWVRFLRGEIARRRDPPDVEQAERDLRDALALASQLGMRPLGAHCHLGLGRLYRRRGEHQQAREHLGHATTRFRAMDMRFWLEQAEVESRALV